MKEVVLAQNIAHLSVTRRGVVRENGFSKPRTTVGRLAQLVQSARFTPRRSQVRILYRPLEENLVMKRRMEPGESPLVVAC